MTLQANTLVTSVRFWNSNKLIEDMLFARRFKTNTKVLSILEEFKSCLSENNIPIQNIIACAIDGAAFIIG